MRSCFVEVIMPHKRSTLVSSPGRDSRDIRSSFRETGTSLPPSGLTGIRTQRNWSVLHIVLNARPY